MTRPRLGLTIGLLIGLIVSVIFATGLLVGAVVGRNSASSPDSSDPNLRDFLAAYHLVTQQSYYRPFNRHQLVYAAIDGMLSATGDPHTLFLSPPQNTSADQQLNGNGFSGIGAVVLPSQQSLEILSPVPDAPAARAGLQAGDRIIRINGQSVVGMTDAIGRIHGRTGTTVRLTVVRSHGRPFVVNVVRAQIAPITAYARVLDRHVGYLSIESFGDTTSDEVTRGLATLQQAHVRALIIDLRANPGGYVQTAQNIVSQFLSHGVVAYEKRADHSLVALDVIPGKQTVHIPLAILVDDQTASAAEITAAALRDEAHAVLIGTRTYGKGSMQSVYSLSDGSTVRITDRLWLTPRKQSISQVGLRPDHPVDRGLTNIPAGSDPAILTAERYLDRRPA